MVKSDSSFGNVEELFDEDPSPVRKVPEKKVDPMRQGLKSIPQVSEEKIELLKPVALLKNEDWRKGNVASAVESTVDRHIENLVIEAMNEFNTLKSKQYKSINDINRQLLSKDQREASASRRAIDDELNLLDDLD